MVELFFLILGILAIVVIVVLFLMRRYQASLKKAIAAGIADIKESEEKYSAVVNNAQDGIVIIQDNICQLANKAFEILGYTNKEVVGQPFIKFIAPEERDRVKEYYSKRMAGENVPPVYETRLIHKNGTLIDVEFSTGIITYGKRSADLVITRDITIRKKLENDIKKRNSILLTELEATIDGVLVVDEKGEIHLIKSSDPKFVSNTYKELLFSLTRGEEPDAYKFHETLRKHGETIPLENEVDVIGSKLSSEESNMLNTIYSDRDLMFNADNKTTTHSTDMNVHLVGDKVAITDQNNVGKVTTQTFDGNVPVSTQAKVEENSELRLITEEEYAEICMKTVNGKELTPEDIKLLDYYDRHNFGETEPTPVTPEETVERIEAYEEQGPVLSLEKPSRKKDSSGFAQKYLPLFMVILTILLGVIVGISIFRIRQ